MSDLRVGKAREARTLALFLAERLHDRNAGQRLLDVRLEAAFHFAFESRGSAQRIRRDDKRSIRRRQPRPDFSRDKN